MMTLINANTYFNTFPNFKLIYSLGKRVARPLYNNYFWDFMQTAAEAATLFENEINKDDIRYIVSLFLMRCEEYGFRKKVIDSSKKGGWTKEGLDQSLTRDIPQKFVPKLCGIEGCENKGRCNDKVHGKLCHRHYRKLQRRIKSGWDDPYDGLEDDSPHYDKRRAYNESNK